MSDDTIKGTLPFQAERRRSAFAVTRLQGTVINSLQNGQGEDMVSNEHN